MKKIIVILLVMVQSIYGSDQRGPYSLTIVSHSRQNSSMDDRVETREDESLCDVAIDSYYPTHFRSQSFRIKPFLRNIIRRQVADERGFDHPVVAVLKRVRSGEMSPLNNHDLQVQQLILEAAHEALNEKERELNERVLRLQDAEDRLKKKMSKRYSALIAAGTSLFGACASGITVYLSK